MKTTFFNDVCILFLILIQSRSRTTKQYNILTRIKGHGSIKAFYCSLLSSCVAKTGNRQPLQIFQRTHNRHFLFKEAEHSYGSLRVYVICQIMAREVYFLKTLQVCKQNIRAGTPQQLKAITAEPRCCSSQAETWPSEKYTDERYKIKISLLLCFHKIHSLDFPINLHTAYYN